MTKTVFTGLYDDAGAIWARLRSAGASSAFVTRVGRDYEVRVHVSHAEIAARLLGQKPAPVRVVQKQAELF